MGFPRVTKDGRQDRIQEGIVERQQGKMLVTTSNTGGISKEVEQLTYKSWMVKERNQVQLSIESNWSTCREFISIKFSASQDLNT